MTVNLVGGETSKPSPEGAPPASRVDRLVEEARGTYERVGPLEAVRLQATGGLLVDIRPAPQRSAFGIIPAALIVERNNLEWRLDPTSPDRLPEVTGAGQPVVVVCQQGYASSLAAVSLRQLGMFNATDLIGGIEAWAEAGLPVERPAPATTPGTV